MTIKIGDSVPDIVLKQVTGQGPADVNIHSLLVGKTVVLFGVPGAFTPICTEIHMAGFSQQMEDFKARKVEVMCVAVNDPFVMGAWAKEEHAHPDIIYLSDWHADFTHAIGLARHIEGLGLRSSRYSMIIKDGIVKALNVEFGPGSCKVSDAGSLLSML